MADPWAQFADAPEPEAIASPAPGARDQWAPQNEAAPDPAPVDEWAQFAEVDPQIENMLDDVENQHADTSTTRAYSGDSPGQAVVSTEVKTIESPWAKRHGAQLGKMIAGGVPDAEIVEFVQSTGGKLEGLQEALDFRHSPDWRIWKRDNPKSAYPIGAYEEIPLQGAEKQAAENSASSIGSAGASAMDSVTMGWGDELYGLAGGDVEDFRRKQELSQQNHPYAAAGGQIAGGLIFPGGRAGAPLRQAAQDAFVAAVRNGAGRAAAREAAKAAARKFIVTQSAKEGAAYGATYGAGSANGDGLDRAVGGVQGGLVGGLGGAGLAAAGTQLPRLRAVDESLNASQRAVARPGVEAMAAAGRQGVDLLPADVGGPVTRRATSVAAQTIAGGQPIIAGAQRTVSQSQAARDRIASTFGRVLEPEAAGQSGISGAKSAIASTRNEARAIYTSAEKMTQGFNADPKKALAALDNHIAELEQTPGGAEGVSALRSIRDDLAKGKTTVSGIRQMRTTLRDQFLKEGLRGSDIERRVNQVVDAASEDVADSLRAAGKGQAAGLFAKADAAWKSRIDLIDNTFEPMIGTKGNPKSGERVMKALTADLQGNNARAVKFLKAMPEEERGDIVASIIGALGRPPNGAPDDFSLNYFLSQWNKMGSTAKGAYFGPEARAALNDLAKVAESSKAAMAYANRSNTGGVVGNLGTLATGTAGLPTFLATVGGQYLTGRLLASPRFARWLARAPRAKDQSGYIDKLASIARAEPAIAADIAGLQKALENAFNAGGTARLAAEPVNETAGIGEAQQNQQQSQPQQVPQ